MTEVAAGEGAAADGEPEPEPEAEPAPELALDPAPAPAPAPASAPAPAPAPVAEPAPVLAPPLDDPAAPEPEPPAQLPAGGAEFPVPAFETESPGSGNWRSSDSVVVQPFPMFALNRSGNLLSRLKKVSSVAIRSVSFLRSLLFEPPVTVTGAQFMYISRLPILLNQVQARVYLPGLKPSGIL